MYGIAGKGYHNQGGTHDCPPTSSPTRITLGASAQEGGFGACQHAAGPGTGKNSHQGFLEAQGAGQLTLFGTEAACPLSLHAGTVTFSCLQL